MKHLLLRTLPALACLAGAAAAPAASAADTVADKVFGPGLLAGVTAPAVFRYRYELRGVTMSEPYASRVVMDVREVGADGGKKVWFDMFEGQNRREFGPTAAKEQNPLVIMFLQRDVEAMRNLTGGSAGYFQQGIRRSFSEPAEVAPVEVEFDGRKVPATRVVIHPFRADPSIARFPKFRDKAYEFVVAPEVPGGLYRIASSTPAPEGGTVLEESMTFERVDRSATHGSAKP